MDAIIKLIIGQRCVHILVMPTGNLQTIKNRTGNTDKETTDILCPFVHIIFSANDISQTNMLQNLGTWGGLHH